MADQHPIGEKQRHLLMAVEQAAEAIVVTDVTGCITYVNPAFERTSGYSFAEALGQNPSIVKSGAQGTAFYRALWDRLQQGEVWRGQFINKRKDGTLYPEDATISPVKDEAGAVVGYVAVKRDLTREVKLQEQFHQAQKMEAIGLLAGGVAHDFNNLLGVILGHVDILQDENNGDPKHLNAIQQAAKSAACLTRQLLAFSRRQVLSPSVLDLNVIVRETGDMLHRVLPENVKLVLRLGPHNARVKADRHQIEQIILNLAVNARDAMPNGGTVTIEVEKKQLTEAYRSRHDCVQPGKYVLLSVTDTGCGMSQEIQSRIFEPFFTTKAQGRGTGLGLATVYGIVKQSDGYIWVYSELGRGTTFKVYLPSTDQPVELSRPPSPSTVEVSGKYSGAAILVEDQPDLRDLVKSFLEDAGLRVLEASNAEEAMPLVGTCAQDVRLLVTDIILHGKDGVHLAGNLANRITDLKTIFMSGYAERTLLNLPARSGTRFLAKPFSRDEFLDAVASLLTSKSRTGATSWPPTFAGR